MKPEKPRQDFPLFPHSSGKWAKKISGKMRYFGRWESPENAEREYRAFLSRQDNGTNCPNQNLKEATFKFLDAKQRMVEHGELSQVSLDKYKRTCKMLVECIGDVPVSTIGPSDFSGYKMKRAKSCNVQVVTNEIVRVRTLFKWLHESRIIPQPAMFGPDFKRATAKTLRLHRKAQGKKLYDAAEVRLLLNSGFHMRAMILLGISCGFGPTDVATLPMDAVDLDGAWISYHRQKTGIDRECPLWPEAVEAMRLSLQHKTTRPEVFFGFDPQTVKKGIGLANIRRRAELLDGTMLLDSEPGKGCTLIIRLRVD
jgi:hypothetical protein